MKIGDFLKKQRKKKMLIQSELSSISNVNQTTISYIEKYNRMPKFDDCCKICEALDIAPNELWKNIRDECVEAELPSSEREEGRGCNGGEQRLY